MPMTTSDIVDLASKIVTIATLPVAVFTIWYQGKMAQKSMDLQIVASFSKQFHDNWSTKWRSVVESGKKLDEIDSPLEKLDYYDILNWIDWVGTLIEEKSFTNPRLMLKSIEPILKKIITSSSITLNKEKTEWSGVFSVASWLGLVDENGMIIDNLKN